MHKKFEFTDYSVNNLKLPAGKKQESYSDIIERGLSVIVYSRSKKYIMRLTITGKSRYSRTIGDTSKISVSDARKIIKDAKDAIAAGKDPEDRDLTFKSLLDKYIKDYGEYHLSKESLKILSKGYMKKAFSQILTKKLCIITNTDIRSIFNFYTNSGKLVMANRILATLTAIFNKAIKWGIIDFNPCSNIDYHKEKSRDRFLNQEELKRFIGAAKRIQDSNFKDILKLALYTGARKSNILSMQWSDIDLSNNVESWHIKGSNSKNGIAYTIALNQAAVEVLFARKKITGDSQWVFPCSKSRPTKHGHIDTIEKRWEKFKKQIGLNDFCFHDLRRTFGSYMTMEGANMQIVGKALGHSSPGSTQIYAKLENHAVRNISNLIFNNLSLR